MFVSWEAYNEAEDSRLRGACRRDGLCHCDRLGSAERCQGEEKDRGRAGVVAGGVLHRKGRHEEYLCECLFRASGRRQGCVEQGLLDQGREGTEEGKKEGDEAEKSCQAVSARGKAERAAAMRGPFSFAPANYFCRGGIWMSSASCSLVSGLSRNLSFTASRMAPSRSAK